MAARPLIGAIMIKRDYRYLAERETDKIDRLDRAYTIGDRLGELVVVLVIFAAAFRW